jgi:hypothetical protein
MIDRWLTDALISVGRALIYGQRAQASPDVLDALLAAKAALLREEQRRFEAAQTRRSA